MFTNHLRILLKMQVLILQVCGGVLTFAFLASSQVTSMLFTSSFKSLFRLRTFKSATTSCSNLNFSLVFRNPLATFAVLHNPRGSRECRPHFPSHSPHLFCFSSPFIQIINVPKFHFHLLSHSTYPHSSIIFSQNHPN